jgi:hypothetical protein
MITSHPLKLREIAAMPRRNHEARDEKFNWRPVLSTSIIPHAASLA